MSESPQDRAELDFESRYAAHVDSLRGYVFRMVGHPAEAQDVLQEVALKAYERRESLRSQDAFRSWLFRIATTTCLDHLRRRKRWRPFSQSYVEQECAESDELRQEVIDTTYDPEFAFDVGEHLAFCFTCVGRSLEPRQQAAIILREVLGFSNREAAESIGISEPALRHALADGRRSMEQTYDGLCALINKQGICHQCAGFRRNTRESRRGPALPVLHDAPDPFEARLSHVRASHFLDGKSRTLHDLLFSRIQRLERTRERD